MGVLCGLMFLSCEKHKLIPFEFPKYEPILMIHGAASPQSGGMVLVRYNQPMGGIAGVAPDLPSMEVSLSDDEGNAFPFIQDTILYSDKKPEQNIQTAYFYIHPDSLELLREVSYTLHVADLDGNVTYVSTQVFLPPQPEPHDLVVHCNEGSRLHCSLSLYLDPVSEPVSAVGFRHHPTDSLQGMTDIPAISTRLFPEIFWPDFDTWTESRPYEISFTSYSRFSTVHISYLSEDLAKLMKEISKNSRLGEDIFAILQPYHSNINDIPGVFGLYNEALREVEK